MTPLRIGLIVATLAVAAHGAAQAPPAAASAPVPPPAAPPRVDLPTPPANFEYRPEGRRDPVHEPQPQPARSPRPTTGAPRPSGVAGLGVDELVVRGIVQSQGAYVAMVSGPTGQTFIGSRRRQAVRRHGAGDHAGGGGDPAAGQ